MMTFYLAICRNRFYFYSDNCKPVYLDGEPFFEYESGKIREATGRLTEKIVDENNLSNANELRFLVIENSDAALNDGFAKAQGIRIDKRFPLNELLRKTIDDLAKNPKLYVGELGVNYDGKCYRLENSLLTVRDFSLTALTIEPQALIKFVD